MRIPIKIAIQVLEKLLQITCNKRCKETGNFVREERYVRVLGIKQGIPGIKKYIYLRYLY